MGIQRWHWGKIVILWAWGGLFGAVLLKRFLSIPASSHPTGSTLSFVAGILILGVLTAITWLWLGGKEGAPSDPRSQLMDSELPGVQGSERSCSLRVVSRRFNRSPSGSPARVVVRRGEVVLSGFHLNRDVP